VHRAEADNLKVVVIRAAQRSAPGDATCLRAKHRRMLFVVVRRTQRTGGIAIRQLRAMRTGDDRRGLNRYAPRLIFLCSFYAGDRQAVPLIHR
jgi:hypothetical protein